MNNVTVEIFIDNEWKDYTPYLVSDFKFAVLLDERLDEATITLKRVPKGEFEPLTRVKITATNTSEALYDKTLADKIIARNNGAFGSDLSITYNVTTKRITQKLTMNYVLASDNAVEKPNGSGKYDHTIYLIELTKILEGFIGESITFTNALGNNYVD